MKISDLLYGVDVIYDLDVEISGICFDSREAKPNYLFVAHKGVNVDGHFFIEKSIENGCTAVLCEEIPSLKKEGVIYVKSHNTNRDLGIIASNFYNNPSSHLKLVGVTGTNGKTTIATLLYHMFKNMGYKVGLISTVCCKIDDKELPSTHTTPDAIKINQLLAEMVNIGCEYCFMEVSSHAAVQQRISGLNFKGGIFTNLTHDHLDYHKTYSEYIKAKKIFFDMLSKQSFALVNNDDKNGTIMLQNTKASKYSYSCKSISDFRALEIESHMNSTLININGRDLWTNFTGLFNIYNIAAVYATARLLGVDVDKALYEITRLYPVSGRFETFTFSDITVIVDYAHTPDALENVLMTINKIERGFDSSIITIVGAGGDRDKTKRPQMAYIASKYSDKVILTSDNPRTENPASIIDDMMAGVVGQSNVISIEDRREAIEYALGIVTRNDVLLIAGKGHEDYQEINGVRHHFDDREIVKEWIKNR